MKSIYSLILFSSLALISASANAAFSEQPNLSVRAYDQSAGQYVTFKTCWSEINVAPSFAHVVAGCEAITTSVESAPKIPSLYAVWAFDVDFIPNANRYLSHDCRLLSDTQSAGKRIITLSCLSIITVRPTVCGIIIPCPIINK